MRSRCTWSKHCSLPCKYCFLKGVNENPYSLWLCIHDDSSILTGECGCVAVLISPCRHVFAILGYTENEVNLGHNKTCTGKKQKWDVRVYRKSEVIHPLTKIGNVLLNQIWNINMTKYQNAYQEKDLVLTLDHLMIRMCHFVRKIGKNLEKQGIVLPVSSYLIQLLFQVLLSQHPWLLGLLLFGILCQI